VIQLQQIKETHAEHLEDDAEVVVGDKVFQHLDQGTRLALCQRVQLKVSNKKLRNGNADKNLAYLFQNGDFYQALRVVGRQVLDDLDGHDLARRLLVLIEAHTLEHLAERALAWE
jgi:hypothetical protein